VIWGRTKGRGRCRGQGGRGGGLGGGRGRGRGNGHRRFGDGWKPDERRTTASVNFRTDVIRPQTPHYPDRPAKIGDQVRAQPNPKGQPEFSYDSLNHQPMPIARPPAPAVLIDKDLCLGCGICADTCPVGAIAMRDSYPNVGEECTACGLCAEQCSNNAITLVRERV